MPFAGVELPDDLGQQPAAPEAPSAPSSPEGAAPEGAQNLSTQDSTETPKTVQDILDLDKLERVRWGGKEWSIKDLQKATLRQEDYSRKTAEVAKSREYVANFPSDLRIVLKDPNRLQEFRKIYPKSYVDVVEQILQNRSPEMPKTEVQPEANPKADPRVDELYSKFQTWEEQQHTTEVEKFESWLDNQMDTFSKKYDFADRENVLARAQVISDQGNKLTDKILERLFKENHEQVKGRWEKKYQERNTKQIQTGAAGKDVGVGGGIPGQSPQRPKTIKEARAGLFSKFE